jgi:hypothetical protein
VSDVSDPIARPEPVAGSLRTRPKMAKSGLRQRSVRRFTRLGHSVVGSLEEVTAQPLNDGLTSILSNNRWFDVLYMDRGADVTFVAFHSALTNETTNYPVFSSHKMSAGLDVNYLGFADPLCGSAESLATGWHLGSKRVNSQLFIPAIIRHAIASRSGKHLLFFGSSAGGFAALNYSARFPGSAALVVNPRVDLFGRPDGTFPRYATAAYQGVAPERVAKTVPTSMAELYSRPRGNTVAYLQNLEDSLYLDHHFRPFETATSGRSDVFVKTRNWGQGHVVPPRAEYLLPLQALVMNAPDWDLGLADGFERRSDAGPAVGGST